jgi:hypothetical protein
MKPEIKNEWRVEKRVANTTTWAVVAVASSRSEAIRLAHGVLGGESTGVRIAQTDSPYRRPEIVVGT